jgi:hypothetical protein
MIYVGTGILQADRKTSWTMEAIGRVEGASDGDVQEDDERAASLFL